MSLPSLPPISTGSSVLSNATTAALALGNIALVVPSIINGFTQSGAYQPQNPPLSDGTPSKLPQPKAFLFDYDGEQSVELSSDITDHFTESNNPIQDNIALKSVKIVTRGFISELNDIPPAFLQIARTIAQKLTAVSAYAPSVSETAQIAYNQAFQAYQTAISLANAAVAAWSSVGTKTSNPTILSGSEFSTNGLATSFSTLSTQSRQQIAFQIFYGYWASRTLFTIQTPWAVHSNMAIENVRAIQSEDTAIISEFECRFKQIRTVKSAMDQSDVSQGRASTMAQSQSNLGTSTPVPDIDLGFGLSNNFPSLFSVVG